MYIKKEDAMGLVIVLGVILIIAAFFLFAPKTPQIAYQPVEATGSALTVADVGIDTLQDVSVSATVKKAGFITFHQAIGDAPGTVVGKSAYLTPGEYPDMTIHLDAPLEADNQYFGLLFEDDGDKVYEPGVDLPIMSNGQVIKVHFITEEM